MRESYDLYTWGYGGCGALGNQYFRDEVHPWLVLQMRAHGGTLVVSCGFDHTVVVNGDLRARGFGRAQEGQLDVPVEACTETPAGVHAVLVPTPPAICRGEKPLSVQSIAAGGMHTACVTVPRVAHDAVATYFYGRSSEGQLGVADPAAREVEGRPPSLKLPPNRMPMLVGCGGLHSALVTEHGHLYTWGHSYAKTCAPEPLPARLADWPAHQPAWDRAHPSRPRRMPGRRAHGQTGQSTREQVAAPRRLPSTAFEGRAEKERPRPVIVSAAEEGGATFKMRGQPGTPLQVSCIACGYYHSAACTIEGELYAWGKNSDGQLGLGDRHDRGFPHLVHGLGADLALQVACGGRHTVALSQRGVPWSCGCNEHRQLGRGDGYGDGALELKPVVNLRGVRIVQAACGGAHSVVLASDGSCYTWGKNQNGQLGLGHANPTEIPTMVPTLPKRATWVACGGAHTVALLRLPDENDP